MQPTQENIEFSPQNQKELKVGRFVLGMVPGLIGGAIGTGISKLGLEVITDVASVDVVSVPISVTLGTVIGGGVATGIRNVRKNRS